MNVILNNLFGGNNKLFCHFDNTWHVLQMKAFLKNDYLIFLCVMYYRHGNKSQYKIP
jgi:hypothetical protein